MEKKKDGVSRCCVKNKKLDHKYNLCFQTGWRVQYEDGDSGFITRYVLYPCIHERENITEIDQCQSDR